MTNFKRNNGTGANGQYWSGVRVQSTGSESTDAAYQLSGSWKVGFDATVGTVTRAIALKANQEIHFDAEPLTASGTSTYAGTFNNTKIAYDSVGNSLNLYHTGSLRLFIGLNSIISYKPLSVSGVVRSNTDNTDSCGTAAYRWTYVHAFNVRTHPVTVATLPAAATAGAGTRAFVTDANSTTFASIVAGGGTNGVPVYSDGTNWRIG